MNTALLKRSFFKTLNGFRKFIPVVLGIFLLVSLFFTAVPKKFYLGVFTENNILDSFLGALFGSAAVGNPVVSYVIGGELLSQGITLVAVTAFILSWITVGVFQLPVESMILGKKFAFVRNALSFATALVIAILTVVTLSFI
ncbi:MAG: hypothetical protein ACLFNR_01070 [Candidatus Paceibacterota bacterium]